MDALLPSEIARLVLGYLQEQKCDEAAKAFIETSPLLQECRIVAQRGGRYSTKVGGLSLMDILDKYCAATIMVQEKIIKVSDSEQLKQCNDLLEQLRYLLEGSTSSRGHRFVVNISVPTQNSPAGSFGSPVVPSSGRKRHHSHSERGKRAARSLSNLLERSTQNAITQSCDTVEATLLENLPGHKDLIKQTENHGNILNERSPSKTNFIANNFTEGTCSFNPASTHIDPSRTNLNFNIENKTNQNLSTEPIQQKDSDQIKNKCTAGTSTDELMSYCNTEVQTSDLLENESDDVDPKREPIENLSIITNALLNCTEIQQRIAENINKARESSSSFHENQEHENGQDAANASMLTDFNNAIKSMVEATDSDPQFEDFIHEIFSVGDINEKLEENKQTQASNDQFHTRSEPMEVNNVNVSPETKENNQERNGLEVPLKQRLRSSSRSQNPNTEDEE